MMEPRHDGTETPTVHTKSGDVPIVPLIGSEEGGAGHGRRNNTLKKVLVLIGVLAAVGLIVTFVLDLVTG